MKRLPPEYLDRLTDMKEFRGAGRVVVKQLLVRALRTIIIGTAESKGPQIEIM